MILSFKQKFPWEEETFFEEKILLSAGLIACNRQHGIKPLLPSILFKDEYKPKRHTIRQSDRIKPGTILHMATGVRSKNYNQFNKDIPELAKCRATQRFDLTYRKNNVVALYIDKVLMFCRNREHLYEITPGWMQQFVENDGFRDEVHFFMWFTKPVRNGRIIHWTDLIYNP